MRSGRGRRPERLELDEPLYDADDRQFRRGVWAFLEEASDDEVKDGSADGREIIDELVPRSMVFMRKAIEAKIVTYW